VFQGGHPDRFADGQLRTLQRRIKTWRATEGPALEIYFVQEHRAGELCESDFTHPSELGVMIAGEPLRSALSINPGAGCQGRRSASRGRSPAAAGQRARQADHYGEGIVRAVPGAL
jgi:hypothetical protein